MFSIIEAYRPHFDIEYRDTHTKKLHYLLETVLDRHGSLSTIDVFNLLYILFDMKEDIYILFEQLGPVLELKFGDKKCCSYRWGTEQCIDGSYIPNRCVSLKQPGFLYCSKHNEVETKICQGCLKDNKKEIVHRYGWEHWGNIFEKMLRPVFIKNMKQLKVHDIASYPLKYLKQKIPIIKSESIKKEKIIVEQTVITKQLEPAVVKNHQELVVLKNIQEQPVKNHQEQLVKKTNNEQLVKKTNNEQLVKKTNNEQLVKKINNEQLVKNHQEQPVKNHQEQLVKKQPELLNGVIDETRKYMTLQLLLYLFNNNIIKIDRGFPIKQINIYDTDEPYFSDNTFVYRLIGSKMKAEGIFKDNDTVILKEYMEEFKDNEINYLDNEINHFIDSLTS
jgi:hypothetical protein